VRGGVPAKQSAAAAAAPWRRDSEVSSGGIVGRPIIHSTANSAGSEDYHRAASQQQSVSGRGGSNSAISSSRNDSRTVVSSTGTHRTVSSSAGSIPRSDRGGGVLLPELGRQDDLLVAGLADVVDERDHLKAKLAAFEEQHKAMLLTLDAEYARSKEQAAAERRVLQDENREILRQMSVAQVCPRPQRQPRTQYHESQNL
jgi:hypothetical protein